MEKEKEFVQNSDDLDKGDIWIDFPSRTLHIYRKVYMSALYSLIMEEWYLPSYAFFDRDTLKGPVPICGITKQLFCIGGKWGGGEWKIEGIENIGNGAFTISDKNDKILHWYDNIQIGSVPEYTQLFYRLDQKEWIPFNTTGEVNEPVDTLNSELLELGMPNKILWKISTKYKERLIYAPLRYAIPVEKGDLSPINFWLK